MGRIKVDRDAKKSGRIKTNYKMLAWYAASKAKGYMQRGSMFKMIPNRYLEQEAYEALKRKQLEFIQLWEAQGFVDGKYTKDGVALPINDKPKELVTVDASDVTDTMQSPLPARQSRKRKAPHIEATTTQATKHKPNIVQTPMRRTKPVAAHLVMRDTNNENETVCCDDQHVFPCQTSNAIVPYDADGECCAV